MTRRRRFHDALGEIGRGQQSTDDRILGWSLRAAAVVDWHQNIESTVVVGAQGFRYRPDDTLAALQEGRSRRDSLSATAELHAHGNIGPLAWSLRPSVRLLGSFGSAEGVDGGRVLSFDASEAAPTYRIGAAISPVHGLSLTGSAFRGVRLPTLLELFGDRATLLPNPRLRPETGRGGDVGLRLDVGNDSARRPIDLHAEARVFSRRVQDLIRYRRTSQFQAVADNTEEGRVRGLEAAVRTHLTRHVRLTATLALLDAQDGQGRALPLRARRRFFARAEFGTGALWSTFEVRAFVDLRHQSSVFADPANLIEVPGRTWTSLGLSTVYRDLRLDITVRDISDRAGFDLIGFPLPGRRVAAMLTYQKEWP